MIRPTMSHVLNKQDLYALMGAYATHLETKIAELEKALRDFEHAVRNENELLEMQKNQDIRDLGQQAKGILDLLADKTQLINGRTCVVGADFAARAKALEVCGV
jgi:hypothetical protein